MDTSALIDLFKNNVAIIKLLENVEEEVVFNKIVYFELMLGLNPEKKEHQNEEAFYDNFFKNYDSLNLNEDSCKKARDILFKLKKHGKTIEPLDCAIAAIYLSNGVSKIITKNKKHFEQIENIEVVPY